MDLQNMSATSIVALFQTNKEQRKAFAEQVIESVVESQVQPLNIHLQIKAMEDIIDQIKSDPKYREALLNEAEKNGKKFSWQNSKIDIREVGTKYNFDNCNDPIYLEMKSESTAINEKVKSRETFLKTVSPEGMTIVDESTGEAVTIYPPSKTSTTSVVVTLQ